MKESIYYVQDKEDAVLCTLCPKACKIKEGEYGFCKTRINEGGKLYLENYGNISSIALDPIEKKPLYEFMPGSTVLSVGLYGCNMNCPFCQNHSIVETKPKVRLMSVEELVNTALDLRKYGNIGVAYTYNEPLIGYEFVLDCSKAVKAEGMKNILVSNGMICKGPLEKLLPNLDAANIDLKCFSSDTYQKVYQGNLDIVKNNIRHIYENNVHLEITMLIVPGLSDDSIQFRKAVEFIAEISPKIPLHITRYFPSRNYDLPPTSKSKLNELMDIAKIRLSSVYLGNV